MRTSSLSEERTVVVVDMLMIEVTAHNQSVVEDHTKVMADRISMSHCMAEDQAGKRVEVLIGSSLVAVHRNLIQTEESCKTAVADRNLVLDTSLEPHN